MKQAQRQKFNREFLPHKHQELITYFGENYPDHLRFKVSETPIFLSREFGDQLLDVSNAIIDQIIHSDILTSKAAVPPSFNIPNAGQKPHFLALDYGICKNKNGELEPQLIELQGFPSLFFYQKEYVEQIRKQYHIPKEFTLTPKPASDESKYVEILKKLILDDFNPENVVLMELFPHRQKTRIDFALTEKALGIETVCITEIKKEGEDLYYIHDGVQTPIYRIYNRVIFDELLDHPDLDLEYNLSDNVNVEWVTHPDWFHQISKFILPQLHHQYIPKSYYVKDFPLEEKLSDYVLKPLFSFAGKGVIINPNHEDLNDLNDTSNYILQKKVEYASIFEDVNRDKAKAEIRLLYVWFPNDEKPILINNLVRMTKAEKVNVDHLNDNKIWTGASVAFFE